MTKWRTQAGRYAFKFGGSFFPVCLPTTRRIREPHTGRVGESQERLQRSEREWDEVIQVVIESLPERAGRYAFKFGGSFFPVCLPTTRRIREPRTGRVGESQERLQRSEREWDEVIQVVIESLPERVSHCQSPAPPE
ncbi:UNVERIFIED_CONTAM: hypothetical protein FKN15_070430 [Acipenser sinensis]